MSRHIGRASPASVVSGCETSEHFMLNADICNHRELVVSGDVAPNYFLVTSGARSAERNSFSNNGQI